MGKYLLLTYGEPGWRGVQVRALRIAEYFDKSEVLFWNLYDTSFIKTHGFSVEEKDPGLTPLEKIVFPKETEVVIFADLPSNELFLYSVFQKALLEKKKIVICEQLYNRTQMKRGVMRYFGEHSDLFLLNSLSSFKDLETDTVKIIPPQIELLETKVKRRELGIAEDAVVLLGVGYHGKVFEKLTNITEQLTQKFEDVYSLILSSSHTTVQKAGKVIYMPFVSGKEYFQTLYAADVVMVKFGFLQILEALALHKPTIVLGEGGYMLRDQKVLDKTLQDVLRFDFEITDQTYLHLEKLVKNTQKREEIVSKLKKLHSGEVFGAQKAAAYIKKLALKKSATKKRGMLSPKKLAILVNEEIFSKEEWLKKQEDVYPLCFIMPEGTDPEVVKRLPKNVVTKPIQALHIDRKDEIMPHSLKNIFVFSERKFDGLIDMGTWYTAFLSQLAFLLQEADTVCVTRKTEKLFKPILSDVKSKVHYI